MFRFDLRRFNNPIYLTLFIVCVVLFATTFNLGVDGIFYAIAISAGIVVLIPMLGGAVKHQIARSLQGSPSGMDHLLAPSGYRRAREVETIEEEAQQTIVRPLPNMPLIPEDRIVDASPYNAPTVPMKPQRPVAFSGKKFYPTNLELAPDFQPPLNLVLGRAILCVGMRGSGKTNVAALLMEEIGKFPIPMAIFDYEEDYVTLPEVLERCVIAGHPDWDERHHHDHYWKVDVANAKDVGYAILENGVQMVLEIGTYETLEEAASVMNLIIKGMFAWANEQDPRLRVPALILLDEAQHFLPQDSSVSNIAKEPASTLLKAFMDLNARGRKRGLTPAIFTQRIAQIRKEVIAGSEVYFLGRQSLNNDLERYEELIGKDERGKQKLDRRLVQSFGKGDFIVFESGEMFITHFNARRSEHRGITPDLGAALNRYGNQHFTKSLLLKSAMNRTQTDEEASFVDLYRSMTGNNIEDQEEEADDLIVLGKDVAISKDQFLTAVQLRKIGKSTGYRDLMPVFNLSEHHAKVLNARIRQELGSDSM
ncbi:hypothetical protein [Dictyobacter formicarum]|uniref:Helicase HerA central domain-containing protein n=1 Tax=Dictyobacter formicarum TaxID=2778368 RepID=A0ABQ3VQQ9_9CHLR|nr:hypothetical protein [Dictyobacter formicarum]GHO88041.1 hypothetical protein KSZ_60470 [Dictyobacter formicarum]